MANTQPTGLTVTPTTGRRHFIGMMGWSAVSCSWLLGVMEGVRSGNTDGWFEAAHADSPPTQAQAIVPPSLHTATQTDRQEWAIFRDRFIANGRVIDTGNNNISHTEGQGLGMLFAVAFDDRKTFNNLWDWTQQTLAHTDDGLHSWRYDPSHLNPVDDPNNATDGDLYIAWALWKAAFRWNEPSYAEHARAIASDILQLLVVNLGQRTVLLPGQDGFSHLDRVTVNLSYYCFPAIAELAHAVPSAQWSDLQSDALALIEMGRFGQWMLPPDWLDIARSDGTLRPAAGWPPRYAFDAVRIPLFLSWGGCGSASVQTAFCNYWTQTGPQFPAWVDLLTDETSPYSAPPGMMAVAQVANGNAATAKSIRLPSVLLSRDYYSAALTLLSRLAADAVT